MAADDLPPDLTLGPFAAQVGLTVDLEPDGRPVLRLELGPEHRNLAGVAHGGAIFTLGDTAMGAALHLLDNPDHEIFLSTDVHIRFLRAGAAETLVARPRIEARTRSTRVLTCRVEREPGGEVVALLTGHFRRRG